MEISQTMKTKLCRKMKMLIMISLIERVSIVQQHQDQLEW